MPSRIRLLCALAAFPAGWGVRELAGGAVGGIVVLALIGACALGLAPRRALAVVAAGIACFVAVHLVAALTAVYVGLATGALLFAAVGSRLWRDESFSSAQPATPAT